MANFIFWALIVTVGLAPLPLASNRPWGWGLMGLSIGLQLVLFALAAFFGRDVIQLNFRRYAAALVGFAVLILWCLVQQSVLTPAAWHTPIWAEAGRLLALKLESSIAIAPGAARETVLRLLTYAGIFFLALHLGRDRDRARRVLWSLALAGLAYAVYGLIMFLGHFETVLWYEKWAYRGSLTSTFVNRNSFASYCGLTLIATLALLLDETEGSLRHGLFNRTGFLHFIDNTALGPFVLMVTAVVIATALLFTQSRGGFASTAVGVLALALAFRRARRKQEEAGRVPIFALAVVIAGLVLVSFSGSNLMGRLGDAAGNETGRGAVYAMTLEAIANHPLLGVGLGGFRDIFAIYRDSSLDDQLGIFDRAHNTYLELALELGLPALTLLLAILAGIVVVCARGLLTRRHDIAYPAAGLGATALFALHSAVDFSLQIPAIAAAYALLMGTAYAQSFSMRRHGQRHREPEEPSGE